MKTFATLRRIAACLTVATLTSLAASASQRSQEYVLSARIPGTGGAWDYAIVDPHNSRLYLAQGGVTALDLKTGKLTAALVKGTMTHGVAALGDGSVAVDDATTRTITLFNGQSGEVLGTIPTASASPGSGVHALDALVLEPKTGLLVAINGESGVMILADIQRRSVVGTINLDGKPEFAAVDATGKVYVNLERGEAAEIVAIDVVARKVIARIPLRGCEGPTGIAYDHETDVLMSVCENGIVKFVGAQSHSEVASLSVGKGADAIIFDPRRHRAFVPGAESGTLTVIALRSATDIAPIQTLPTQPGTRLGAVDPATGKVYLPAAKFGAPVPPSPYPSVIPGTFTILVVTPTNAQ